ncbi:MAG TPA: methyltransferase domain-containing protein [Acidimicrobiales bacterium]
MVSFEGVAEEYDAGRPGYPAGVFDALEPLAGARVVEGGAGTGIATRELLARGARVVPVDIGPRLLRVALGHTTALTPVVADGAVLPLRDGCADVVCFAQSWHWLDHERRCGEMARVLRPGGRWAGWWSHARADGEPWYDDYWSLVEAACPGTVRTMRDTDWGEGVRASGLFDVGDRVTVAWERRLPVELWLTDQASHSYVAALAAVDREALLAGLRRVLDGRFPDGHLRVPYETWLWVGRRR